MEASYAIAALTYHAFCSCFIFSLRYRRRCSRSETKRLQIRLFYQVIVYHSAQSYEINQGAWCGLRNDRETIPNSRAEMQTLDNAFSRTPRLPLRPGKFIPHVHRDSTQKGNGRSGKEKRSANDAECRCRIPRDISDH